MYQYALTHHGIKGQRWGVRRFQNKDGSLTPAGQKRYDDSPNDGAIKKSKHRLKLEQKYRDRGMTEEDARRAAAKRIKIEKIVAITGAITVSAATAYVVSKHVRERCDGVIKSGTTIQRITQNPNESLDRAFYAAHDKTDKIKYRGKMAGVHFMGQNVHKVDLKANSDVKVAGRKKAEEVFADLYKNDNDFRERFQKSNRRMLNLDGLDIHKVADGTMSDKQLKKAGYDAFNRGLVNHDEDGTAIAKKFYDRLKSQGYDAIVDINDKKYSGYSAKKPVIIFNKGEKISVANVEKMTHDVIMDNLKTMKSIERRNTIVKEGAKQASMLTAGSFGIMLYNTAAVNRYRSAHPGTKLSDKEIIRMLSNNSNKR